MKYIKKKLTIDKIKKKKVQIGIRLNPNTDAKTLSQISTGKKDCPKYNQEENCSDFFKKQ